MFRMLYIIMCLVLLSFLFLGYEVRAQEMMSIQVKEGQLRTAPSHLGKRVANLSYGDRVAVLEKKGDWKRVSIAGKNTQGWVHATALTDKRIILKAGQSNVATSVSKDEIALAGKGFNEEVESQYRKKNKNINYTWIDRMEAMKVSPEQKEDFISGGHLVLRGEGGQP